jgi:hypothetical protein
MTGLEKMLAFLNDLKDKNVHYHLGHHRHDSLMATLTLVGARIEVDFFADHIEYSIFRGNEDVEDNEAALVAMIDAFTRD